MTANSDRASAQIIQFPARGHFASAGNRDENSVTATTAPRAENAMGIAMGIAMGSGWYHEEAIRDAERDRQH